MARPGKKRRGLFVLEIIVLLLFISGLFVYGQITMRLNKIEQPKLDKEKILVNPEMLQMSEQTKLTGYKTYAVFGVDSRGEGSDLAGDNSDTMIIVSVNNDTKEVKMVSVYRDTILNIGNETYTKANAAYLAGGPEQAISMLNTNLDLNITDYATADFSALVEIVDAVGGLDIPLSYEEIEHMNNYCKETSEVTGKSYTKIEKPDPAPADQTAIVGTYHLNGVQATSYCRIRYTKGDDFMRAWRQREVIQAIADKIKGASVSQINQIVNSVFSQTATSFELSELLELAGGLKDYKIVANDGFPFEEIRTTGTVSGKGSCVMPVDLEANVVKLHKFLFDVDNYVPSDNVKEYSAKIHQDTGK